MILNRLIRIKKRTQPGWLVWLLIMLPFFFGLLNELLGLPKLIRYTLDVAWLWLLLLMVLKSRMQNSSGISKPIIWVWLFLVYALLAYIVQFQSPLYALWGVRNNFRFYVAFFAFIAFLSDADVSDYMKWFDRIFWVSAAVSLFQFFFLELQGDYLGGIFGGEKGSNGYSNIFFTIIVTYTVVAYLNGQEKTWHCFAKCATALLVAALAEMKFLFVEFVLVVALAVLYTRFTWRKLGVILGCSVAVLCGAALLVELFPGFADFFSVEWFLENALSNKGYTSSGDLNRLNAIPQINELWLKTPWQRLFGLGLGNCDTSGFAFLNTPFFEKYGDMHYTWISYAIIYLETGWIGLIFYFGFFLLVYRGICRIQKRSQGVTVDYCVIGKIMAILCMIISVYNSSLRTEAGYMAYSILAIPFVYGKKRSQFNGQSNEVLIYEKQQDDSKRKMDHRM